jgi:hypothetical protein
MIYLVMFLFIFFSSLIIVSILHTIKYEIIASRVIQKQFSDNECNYLKQMNLDMMDKLALLDAKLTKALKEVDAELKEKSPRKTEVKKKRRGKSPLQFAKQPPTPEEQIEFDPQT